MTSIYDIYERKNYRNRIPLAQGVSFEVEVRETKLYVQSETDLSAVAKDSVFRYRYQIEEYLRQHPALRETTSPIQVYAAAPEIVRYTDLSCRTTGVPPMSCIGGAITDFVARDLSKETPYLIVSGGGDTYVRCPFPVEIHLYADGSPLDGKLILLMPAFKRPFGISTYAPGHGIHAVTVVSRSASWASAFARDIGDRLVRGDRLGAVLDRAQTYADVGGLVLVSGGSMVVGGDLVIRCVDGEPGSE
jgi:uncharacterized protein